MNDEAFLAMLVIMALPREEVNYTMCTILLY